MEQNGRMTTFELVLKLKEEYSKLIAELSEEYDPNLVAWVFEAANQLISEPMTDVMVLRNMFAALGELGRVAADTTISHLSQIAVSTFEEEMKDDK